MRLRMRLNSQKIALQSFAIGIATASWLLRIFHQGGIAHIDMRLGMRWNSQKTILHSIFMNVELSFENLISYIPRCIFICTIPPWWKILKSQLAVATPMANDCRAIFWGFNFMPICISICSIPPWFKFSKFSSLVICYKQYISELTFENFHP